MDYMHSMNHVLCNTPRMQLQDFGRAEVQQLYNFLALNHSPNLALHVHSVLRIAINYAIDNDLIVKNPLRGVVLPKKEKYHPVFISANELQTLLIASEYHGIYNAVLLAGYAGLRRGEVLGLTVPYVDTEKCILEICRSVEYRNGERIVSLPKSDNSYRRLLVSERFISRLLEHHDGSEYFCDYTQGVLYKRFSKCLKETGMKPMRFHDLRHTYASLLLESGEDIKNISFRLGHSSVTLTLDTYVHLNTNSQRSSADALDYIIP